MRLSEPILNRLSLGGLADGLVLWFRTTVERINERGPAGGCILWPDSVAAPRGWLIADGSTVDTEIYPDIAEVYGASGATFALPDPPSPPTGFVWIVAI